MSEINGGSFIQGFAAGALSSIAASAWSGGATTTTSWKGGLSDGAGFVTETTVHSGLGAGTCTIGMIAFGTVMGGAGAALTGGNFWQGAITGLVVSGLNHAMHQTDPPKKGKTSDGKFYGGDGSGDLLDWTNRVLYEINEFNPVANIWNGIEGMITGTDHLGNSMTANQSLLKIASAIPVTKVGSATSKITGKLSYQVINRSSKGADGALSRHIIERLDNKVISKTHQVINNSTIIHQHQHHIGTYGTIRQFPEAWINYITK